MSTFTQQDAQEYYSRILDELEKEVTKASRSKRRTSVSWAEATKSLTLPETGGDEKEGEKKEVEEKSDAPEEQPKVTPNPLDGLLAQRVGCTVCGYSEGLSMIPFNCITVSLGRNRSGYDIRECLDEYTDLEYIEGVECSKCTLLKLKSTLTPLAQAKPESPFATRLQAVQEALDDEKLDDKTLIKTFNIPKKNWVKSEKSKQAVIARAPRSLVLHVNRSIFDETTFAQYKNNAGVSYPSVLDLGNWCLGTHPSDSQKPDMDLEEWPRDPRKSMLAGGNVTTTSPFQYKLRAAVTHFGTHGNGHYVCYRPHPRLVRKQSTEDQVEDDSEDDGENKQDREDEEEDQSTLTEEQWWRFSDDSVYAVSEQEAHQGNVFMLFYERIDESTPSNIDTSAAVETLAVTSDAPLPPSMFRERSLRIVTLSRYPFREMTTSPTSSHLRLQQLKLHHPLSLLQGQQQTRRRPAKRKSSLRLKQRHHRHPQYLSFPRTQCAQQAMQQPGVRGVGRVCHLSVRRRMAMG